MTDMSNQDALAEDEAAERDQELARPRRQGPGLVRIYLGRIVTVLYAFIAVSAALVTVLADLGLEQVVVVVGALAALAPVIVKFLEGVQTYEKAGYSRDLKILEANAQLEIIGAEARAAAEIGGPRQTGPRIATR